MAKPTNGRPIQLRTRQPINWRIPIDVLERLDGVRGGRDRTSCVVEALQRWVATQERARDTK